MSVQERLNNILTQASQELGDKNYVAILGLSGVGKTVLVTLINHALDNYFLERYPEIKAHIASGIPFLEACETSILEGEFPHRTQPLSRDEIVLEFSRKGATGTISEIRFPDISGEDFNNMCLGEEITGAERALKVFETAKPKGKPYGDMGYVLYAKMYLILLDCSKLEEWEKNASRYAQALRTILEFKKELKQTRNGKIENPIGIILTKADTLHNPNENAENIINSKMKRFLNTLNSVHEGKKDFFKLYIDVERNADNAISDPTTLKVKKPLTYSRDEYVRLISWIHENI
ncbi:MAG: ATP-binding protein [Thaumarchaeota archaeon]|nr:ATP-binding protein [Nitrososphaerota archaeon]MBI3641078.1 ATP-binding protein [Nitrososphaerota archaeon]